MSWFISTALILISFLSMEFVAWFSHKYVMHGVGWILHRDHHVRTNKKFEWNDLFALIFATPSVILLVLGSSNGFDYRFYIGLGIALYGLTYFLFHDVLVHKRIPIFNEMGNPYFRAVVSAHVDHHMGKKNYGFLFMFPWKYFKPINQQNVKFWKY